jgi:CPA2 family monovalent cation:H+ antiporter-2
MPGSETRGQRRVERLQRAMNQARRRVPHASLGMLHEPGELARVFPILADCQPDDRAELFHLFRPRSAQPGERIFRAGDRADALYFIAEGRVEVELPDERRVELGPGEIFGEMALLSGQRRSADVVALDYCQFLVLTPEDFEAFIAKRPQLRERLHAIAQRRSVRQPDGEPPSLAKLP